MFIIFLPAFSIAQRIDNTATQRDIPGKGYFRFHYDNDFFSRSRTDYYYTQGYSFEIAHPVFAKNPLSKIHLRYRNRPRLDGLAFEHFGFTPTSIKSDEILRGDRPFAGVIMLKSFSVSVDTARRQRLSSVLSLGMVGQAAFAGQMQTAIHRWSGDAEPHGWQYQIRNDVVVNYELNHERQLIAVPDFLSLNSNAQIRLGTLSDKVQAGLMLSLGYFDSAFSSSLKPRKKNLQIYVYSQPLGSLVGYDATLQSGLFNRSSPYTIPASEINRFTFQHNYGVVLRVRKFYAEYYRTYLSREFKTGREHVWGGVKLGVAF
ncbi:lipid A deacylase LpxR family protein [Persicitalea sp.]|uniref:lipid A deacylase LpxR family protein n=1 Tax=Persicitalea sp. TaxID=3100273 RepID=UPI0035935DE0